MKEKRNFHVSDARYLEHTEVLIATMPEDLANFTAFDPIITGEYVTQVQQAIDNAKTIPPDEVVIDQLAEQTLYVDKAFEDCYNDYKTLSYYIKKAFKSNLPVQNQFGLNDIVKARKSQPKMVVFMQTLADIASKYTGELTEAGCPAELITGLPEKATTLHNANLAQEKFKNERAYHTQQRILLLNKVAELLRPVYDVAAIIYAGNQQKLNIYKPPKRPKKGTGTSDTPEAPATPDTPQ
ncbi:MAG: hypothetical protein IH595_03815 [Bacteroidales bacterium]|nr:hypothetical protein [Bacteroidales bacterium]